MNVLRQLPPSGAPPSFGNSRSPQFGGIGDAVSNVIGYVDGNRLAELASTDILGMCLPRTGIEASLRPSGYRTDAARETAIREFSGLVMNTVAVGGFSYLFLQLLGNRVNWYNPHGIPSRAWISADSMETFGNLYERILTSESIHTPLEARERFIRTVLSGLASSSKKPSLIGMLKAAEGLDEKARLAFLEPAFLDNPETLNKLKSILKENPADLVQYASELDAGYSGKLSPQALEELVEHFKQKTNRFDVQAMKRTQELLLQNPKVTQYLSEEQQVALRTLSEADRYDQLLKLLPEHVKSEAQQVFTKHRLQFSTGELRYGENGMVGLADRTALAGGLTDTVQLLDDNLGPLMRDENGKPLMMSKNRKTVLREMKHFLEQYVDRATHEARDAGNDWKNKTHETLYGKPDQAPGSFWQKGIAKAEDGLIPAAIKSKWAFTWIPLTLTVLASVGVAFYNNWLTQQKHGGRVISPIDGSTPDAPTADPTLDPMTLSEVSELAPVQANESSFASRTFSTQSNGSTSMSPFEIFQKPKNVEDVPS